MICEKTRFLAIFSTPKIRQILSSIFDQNFSPSGSEKFFGQFPEFFRSPKSRFLSSKFRLFFGPQNFEKFLKENQTWKNFFKKYKKDFSEIRDRLVEFSKKIGLSVGEIKKLVTDYRKASVEENK